MGALVAAGDVMDAASPKPPALRYWLAAAITYVLFSNHWSRDSVGALELPLEQDAGFMLTPYEYNLLSSVYFFPNIVVPLVAGAMAQRNGPAVTYVLFLRILCAGNVLVGLGAVIGGAAGDAGGGRTPGSFWLLLAGRACMGIAYEAVDVLPIGFMAPLFPDQWARIVGVINGMNRLGSVGNFLVAPLAHSLGGVRLALLIASGLGASALVAGSYARRLDRRIRAVWRPAEAPAAAPASAAPASDRDAGAGYGLAALRGLGGTFWLYLLGSACVYGCVVPFWFIGAKHIVLFHGATLAEADAMLLLPEGLIALVAPPFGALIDRQRWTLRRRLCASALSLALIPGALLALAWQTALPPLPLTALLGLGYAFAQNLVWASITLLVPPAMLNYCAGIVGSAVNLAPALLPVLAFGGGGSADLSVLAAVGVVGVVVFLVAAAREGAGRASRPARSAEWAPAELAPADLALGATPQAVVVEESGSGTRETPDRA